jgi:hydroxypyruvate isomerase
MLHFAANLSFLYNDVAFTERFAAAAHDGIGNPTMLACC